MEGLSFIVEILDVLQQAATVMKGLPWVGLTVLALLITAFTTAAAAAFTS